VVTLGVLWFVVTMLPVSNLLFGSSVLLAERTLYFPSIGFVLMVGWAFAAAVPSSVGGARLWRRVPVYGLAAVVLLAFSFRSAVRVPTWESTTSVTSTLAVQHPQLARSQEWLARRLIRAGDIQGGVEALYRAERIVGYPGNFTLQFEGGRLLVSSGRPDLAIRFFESAMVLAPDAPRRDAARRELDAAWRAVMAVAAHAYEGG
jgi:hypothetical protein